MASMDSWSQEERDRFYVDQHVHPGNMNNTADRCGWIKEKFQEWRPKSILDVACRDGYVSRSFLRRPHTHIMGVDINPEAIRIAKEEANKVSKDHMYYCRNVMEFCPGKTFDLVMCFEFLEHIPAKTAIKVITNLHVWSHGRVAISTPIEGGRFGSSQFSGDEAHINVYTKDRLAETIKHATGVDATFEERDADFHYVHWRKRE